MDVTHPKNVALIRLQPGESNLLEGIHDLFFLFRRYLVVGMPGEGSGCVFPLAVYAVDESASHSDIASQHLRGACVSPRIIRTDKIAGRFVAFTGAVWKDFHDHGSPSVFSNSGFSAAMNVPISLSRLARAVSTSTASTARL